MDAKRIWPKMMQCLAYYQPEYWFLAPDDIFVRY